MTHTLDVYQPWAVITLAAYAPELAEECARRGVALICSEQHDAHATLDQLLDGECDVNNAITAESAAV